MSLYAAQPARRTRQIVTDVLYVLVLVAAVWLALRLHDAVLGLTGPTDDVGDAGRDLGSGLQDAGDDRNKLTSSDGFSEDIFR